MGLACFPRRKGQTFLSPKKISSGCHKTAGYNGSLLTPLHFRVELPKSEKQEVHVQEAEGTKEHYIRIVQTCRDDVRKPKGKKELKGQGGMPKITKSDLFVF